MKKFFLLFLIPFLSLSTAWADQPSYDPNNPSGTRRALSLKTTIPAANGNFENLRSTTFGVNDLTLRSQNCSFNNGDSCQPSEVGLIRNCIGIGMLMCLENGTWSGVGGSSAWVRDNSSAAPVNYLYAPDSDNRDIRLGFGINNPRTALHFYREDPYPMTMRLQHETAAENSFWDFSVKDIAGYDGILSLSRGIDGAVSQENVIAADGNGKVYLMDNSPNLSNPAAPRGKLNIQNNINAVTSSIPASPPNPALPAKANPNNLAMIVGMNADRSDNVFNANDGTGIGFSVNPSGEVAAAIVAESAGPNVAPNSQAKIHFMVRTPYNAPDLTSVMSISQRGKISFGRDNVGSNSDRLTVDGPFGIAGNINFDALYDNASGTQTPNSYSITGLKTEPSTTDPDGGGPLPAVPTSNHNAATTEFVQNAIALAGASGSCSVIHRHLYTAGSGSFNDLQADTLCTGGTAAGGWVNGSPVTGTVYTCPTPSVPLPQTVGTGQVPDGGVGPGGHVSWYITGGNNPTLVCEHICCFP